MISKKTELKESFFGQKTIIIAKSGYGKSYTARVIVEDGIKKGCKFLIFDPQNAYNNLPGFEYINLEDIKDCKKFGELIAFTNPNVVIITKNMTEEEQNDKINLVLTNYKKNIRKGIQTIIMDEIHKYAPENTKTSSKNIIRSLFQENRSDGLGIVAVTQRISRVDKTIISQADKLLIGRVTSYRDKESVKNYIDEPKDLEKISKLEVGEFYFYNFENDSYIDKINKSETKHTGEAPKDLISTNTDLYNNYKKKIIKNVRGQKKMDDVTTNNDMMNKFIPSVEGVKDLTMIGLKTGLGAFIGAGAGVLAQKYVPDFNLPVISNRSVVSVATATLLYAGFRNVKQEEAKDVLKYACAGSVMYSFGSFAFDVMKAFNVNVPSVVNNVISLATGVKTEEGKKEVEADLNTRFM